MALCLTGCVVPIGSKVTNGHRYSEESLEFLRGKGVTRDEVISTLGVPLVEFESIRTMVYIWHEEPRHLFIRPNRLLSEHPVTRASVAYGSEELWALLVAFDADGRVVAHEERYVDTRSLEEECAEWNRSKKR